MRQAIQELQPQGAKPGQAGLLWPVFLSALMTLGGLLGVHQTFGEHTPGLLVPVLAGLVALLCCLLGWAFQEKHAVLAALGDPVCCGRSRRPVAGREAVAQRPLHPLEPGP